MGTAIEGAPLTVTPRAFMGGANGRWAGEQLVRWAAAGKPISPAALRTLDVLRKDEWKVFDEALVREAQIRLQGVADLIGAGLTKRIPNGLAKTILEYEKISDLDPATVSLDGVTRGENDTVDFELAGLPLPITHKDWYLNLRRLLASRSEGGEGLDTTQSELAGRKIGEEAESMLFNGGKTFGGLTIYGYTTHPDRNTVSFGAGGAWNQAAKTGAQIIADVATMVGAAEADRSFGPYWIYVGGGASLKLNEDYTANYAKTILNRILEYPKIQKVTIVDTLASDEVVMVQPTRDVVQWVIGEDLQTVQWDFEGGFQINFKGFQIGVPLIKSDIQLRSGIVHMS